MPISSTSLPQGVRRNASGVVLSADVGIEVPIPQVLASSLDHQFTVLISLRSSRINNAFLFSIRNKNRLQFGVQLLPRKVVVHTGGKQSVYFDYSVHDEQWHSFAIDVTEKTVSLYAQCGKKHFSRETLSKVQKFDSHSLFTLGRMNSFSVNFEGVICQLDIIPSALASANYCKYVKQQCRQADTYRSQPVPPDSSLGVLPSKQLDEENQPDYMSMNTRKGVSDLQGISNSTPVHVLPEKSPLSTSLCLGNITALETMPEANDRRIGNVSMICPQDTSKKKDGLQTITELLLSLTDNATENTSRNSYPDLLFSIKQTKTKNMAKNTSKQYSHNPVEMQQILNTTLHRASDSLPLNNRLGSWGDETYNSETHYDIDIDGYDYDYEELDRMFEMESLRGPKGDPGLMVSWLCLFLD
ncbi:hypothetical protein lerEdw1_013375 [Lerista edwardsae]|nr:hypothetical protein lerEdw1_013376 [Lerista edwardsae]KAJ6650342.1 hypothetical protein lerEdw1_013375 [Lerista edwardsae]